MSNDYLPDDYTPVHKRIENFREDYPDKGKIQTEIINQTEGYREFKATVYRSNEEVEHEIPASTAFGHAAAKEDKFVGDKWREKAETVAVGRALAFLGYGIEKGVASKEEVKEVKEQKSKARQNRTKPNQAAEKLDMIDVQTKINKQGEEWSESAFSDDPSQKMLGKFNAWWNENIGDDDSKRYEFLSNIIGREIESSKKVLKGEMAVLLELITNESKAFKKLVKKELSGNTGD